MGFSRVVFGTTKILNARVQIPPVGEALGDALAHWIN